LLEAFNLSFEGKDPPVAAEGLQPVQVDKKTRDKL
jgi:hypothetical protein